MTVAIVDTSVVIHRFRQLPAAIQWINSLRDQPSVTVITWLEVMGGVQSKAQQADSLRALDQFDIVYPNMIDFQWAMGQIQKFQFSHRIGS